jgi:biotin carboxylase
MGDHHTTVHDPPLLALVASGDRRYREYLVASAASRYRLWLLDGHEATWQQPYVSGFTQVDTRDPQALLAAARGLDLSGVFCYDEWSVHAAAQLAAALGLPTSPPPAVAACRDKATTRHHLAAAGVPQPRSYPVDSLDQAVAAADKIGYPVVVKAGRLAGSIGVVRVDSADQLETAYTAADGITFPGVPRVDADILIEEYLHGPEISVDSAIVDGVTTPITVAHKTLGLHPFFEETGHLVDAGDPLLHDPELRHHLTAAHQAVGFTHGITHTELRRTPDGWRVVEINARLGGDFIPYLGQLASGIDHGLVAADLAAGRTPDLTRSTQRVAGIRFLYPPRDCVVESVTVHPERFSTHTHFVLATAQPGQQMRLPPRGFLSRYGLLISVADSAADAAAALQAAEQAIELRHTPL